MVYLVNIETTLLLLLGVLYKYCRHHAASPNKKHTKY